MGTSSAGEIIDDTIVRFAIPKTSSDELDSTSAANPSSVLAHKLERKIREPKTSRSRTPVAKNTMDNGYNETSSKMPLVHPSQLLVPAKSPSDQPLVVYDRSSDEEIQFARTPKAKADGPSDATALLLSNDFDVELNSDDEEEDSLQLIRPQPVQSRPVCCKYTCNVQ